ncbi:MAG TPA: carotenoid oxygenase family protein, partial [Vicinamibacterales bacterium]|nr:carotenoid oxygenase family protein [Vicinamibacterales bacterium]
DFIGHNAPSRIECDLFDLVVEGTIPQDLDGTWFRSIPDPQFPPMLGDDTNLSGDGMVSAFVFANGHVDLRMRYVQTDRWKNERAARRGLYGLYRNPYTDDPSVQGRNMGNGKGNSRGVANTTPVFHAGRLFATKEDSRAWEVDPRTLDTVGEWDYEGRLRSQTMTAHPRLDPETGEMYFFGYEAGGLATCDVAYAVANKNGELVREDWLKVPYCALMHDFAVTKEHAIFPGFPIVADLKRLQAGGAHWRWESGLETFVGIMPRDGSTDQLRWFRGPACSVFHIMNAYTEGSKVHLDLCVASVPVFQFIRDAANMQIRPDQIEGGVERWTFDLSKPSDEYERQTLAQSADMPRTATKDMMRDYSVGYLARFNPQLAPPILTGPVGAGFNELVRLEVKSGRSTSLPMEPNSTMQEHVHIPSTKPGHEGYLAFVVDRHTENLAEVFIVEAQHIDKGPIARIKVPMRLRSAVHGTWVDAKQL